jgi:hypothetical protein
MLEITVFLNHLKDKPGWNYTTIKMPVVPRVGEIVNIQLHPAKKDTLGYLPYRVTEVDYDVESWPAEDTSTVHINIYVDEMLLPERHSN